MVSPTFALHQIRRARRAAAPPAAQNLDTYKPQYRAALEAIDALGGEPLVDSLSAWIIDRTKETGRLPRPAAVRKHARTLCADNDIKLPAESPLRD